VREAIFNSIGSLGAVSGATVLDLFAGSGALGIEALSRGAAAATFVDNDRRALEAIRANLETTGLEARATVVATDAERYLDTAPGPFDLALVDPPYAFDRWEQLLHALKAEVVVVESDRPIDVSNAGELVRQKRYGTTVVTIVRCSSAH
jgi:16S rRNA (guanine966-N2)-methyltransferase